MDETKLVETTEPVNVHEYKRGFEHGSQDLKMELATTSYISGYVHGLSIRKIRSKRPNQKDRYHKY